MGDEQTQGIDMEALAALIEQKFQAQVQTFVESQRADQQRAEQERQQAEQQRQQQEQLRQQQEQDTFGTMVHQSVRPLVGQLNLNSQIMEDKFDFYLNHPQAREYHDQVEAKFNEVIRAGRPPIPRADILRWIKGNEQLQKETQEAAQRATQASVMGGGQAHQVNVQTRDPYTMNLDELEAALADRPL